EITAHHGEGRPSFAPASTVGLRLPYALSLRDRTLPCRSSRTAPVREGSRRLPSCHRDRRLRLTLTGPWAMIDRHHAPQHHASSRPSPPRACVHSPPRPAIVSGHG